MMYTNLIQEAINELEHDANFDTIVQYALAVNSSLREDEDAMEQFLNEVERTCSL